MNAPDIHMPCRAAPATPRRDDAARIAIVTLVFLNAWMALAHLDPPRPHGADTQDWHGNVAASRPR